MVAGEEEALRKRQDDPTGHGSRSIDQGLKILRIQIFLFSFLKINNYNNYFRFGRFYCLVSLWCSLCVGTYLVRKGVEKCIFMGCETDTCRVMITRLVMG